MINALRKKFILVAMLSTFIVLFIIVGLIDTLQYHRLFGRTDALIAFLAENEGDFRGPDFGQAPDKMMRIPDPNGINFTEETPYETRFFTVFVDENQEIQKINMESIASVSKEEAYTITQEMIESGKDHGFYNTFRFGKVKTTEGFLYIFVNCGNEIKAFKNLLKISITVSLLGIASVFLLVFIFSKIVFKPVEESYAKQKRFITDASHELKTPLTIIEANTEVLEMMEGESQWSKSIKNQVNRLTLMTNHLVTLTRLDEKGTDQMEDFSLSEAFYDVYQSFVAAFERKKLLAHLDVEEGSMMHGNEEQIRQLLTILSDNMIKYAVENTDVYVSLSKNGRSIQLSMENESQGMPQENMNILFERFYRMDSSRNSEKGGSGIGLSIAQAIVQSHKGKIVATSPDLKSIRFVITFRSS